MEGASKGTPLDDEGRSVADDIRVDVFVLWRLVTYLFSEKLDGPIAQPAIHNIPTIPKLNESNYKENEEGRENYNESDRGEWTVWIPGVQEPIQHRIGNEVDDRA